MSGIFSGRWAYKIGNVREFQPDVVLTDIYMLNIEDIRFNMELK